MNLDKHQQYLKNPYLVEGITERSVIRSGKMIHTVDPETGEETILQSLSKAEVRLNDSKSYTKVFHDSGDLIRKLSPAATKVYLYIVIHLHVNWDSIYLNGPDVCTWAGISNASFYRAINELLTIRIIARKLGSYLEYWVNPNIIYNGDRVKLFRYFKQSVHGSTKSPE